MVELLRDFRILVVVVHCCENENEISFRVFEIEKTKTKIKKIDEAGNIQTSHGHIIRNPKTEPEPNRKNRDRNRTENYKNPNGSYISKSEKPKPNRDRTENRTGTRIF